MIESNIHDVARCSTIPTLLLNRQEVALAQSLGMTLEECRFYGRLRGTEAQVHDLAEARKLLKPDWCIEAASK